MSRVLKTHESAATLAVRKRFGENLRACRKAYGLTQRDLAERANVHHTHIGNIENGSVNSSLDILVKLAIELEVEIHDLLRPQPDTGAS